MHARIIVLASVPCALALGVEPAPAQETRPFSPGMVITGSVRIEPGTYEVPGPASLDSALIVIRGDDVTVDMTGVRLLGIPEEADPDLAAGVAIRIDGGRGVTLRGVTARGYRFGILARGTEDLRLLDNDVSYNWKPRLFSLVAHESLIDWLSFHRNEEREWMRFGAAIYLEDVARGEIRGNRAVQGMNGLLLVRADSLRIEDNEFAFNSALGIGLYRSSRNEILRNRLDFNVRGYSHGFYNRGQDSAGILLYEQSSNNVVAFNSATHGGDGLFLWAGQSTMDTGEGGANDNLIFGNDFSYAPTNSVEITFSRNRVVGNTLRGSRYGVWGGYSWESVIAGNCFGENETGIAIEHGQDNLIERNRFAGEETAVALWANASEPPDWGYPQHRDTRSRDTRIRGNVFAGHAETWRLDNTSGVEIGQNRSEPAGPDPSCDPRELLGSDYEALAAEIPGGPGGLPPVDLAAADRSAMIVDEWGPYDWTSPMLWPIDTASAAVALRVAGPEGRWRVVTRRAVDRVSATEGRTGDTLVVWPAAGSILDWSVELEYVGGSTVGPRGRRAAAGEPVSFSFETFEPLTDWHVRFFAWTDPADDPRPDGSGLDEILATAPILARREPGLDYMWYRPLIAELPQERWALEATTSVTLAPGEYSLRVISDDGIRVWADGALVIDRLDPHGSEVDYAPLSPGHHEIRVLYYQLGGWSELRVEAVHGSGRSRGSAGPH